MSDEDEVLSMAGVMKEAKVAYNWLFCIGRIGMDEYMT